MRIGRRSCAAVLLPGAPQAVEDRFANTPETVRALGATAAEPTLGQVVCAYEAGPLDTG